MTCEQNCFCNCNGSCRETKDEMKGNTVMVDTKALEVARDQVQDCTDYPALIDWLKSYCNTIESVRLHSDDYITIALVRAYEFGLNYQQRAVRDLRAQLAERDAQLAAVGSVFSDEAIERACNAYLKMEARVRPLTTMGDCMKAAIRAALNDDATRQPTQGKGDE